MRSDDYQAGAAGAELPPDGGDPTGLYPSDSGDLPKPARDVIAHLVKGPALDRSQHGNLWKHLLAHEQSVRRHFGNMYLELVVDTRGEVAFVRQADTGDVEAPTLLRTHTLRFMESLILIELRRMASEAQTQGTRRAVAAEDLQEAMAVYAPRNSSDPAGFQKRVQAAFNNVKKLGFLNKLKGGEDRYEISPTLPLVFSVEAIQSLTRQYRALGADALQEADTSTSPSQDEDD